MAKQSVLLVPLIGGFLFLPLIGCSPGRGSLSGKVTFDGKEVKFGTVSVTSTDGVIRTANIQKDGTFEVENILSGSVKIAVSSVDPELTKRQPRKRNEVIPPVDKTGWFPIPEKYSDFEKSGLTFDLQPGSNTLDIQLKK